MRTQTRYKQKGSCPGKREWQSELVFVSDSFVKWCEFSEWHKTDASSDYLRHPIKKFHLRFSQEMWYLTSSGQPNMEKGNKPEENHVSKTSSSAINQDTQVKNEIRQDFQGLGMHNRYQNNYYLVSKWSSRGLHWTFLQLFSILPLRCDHWNKIDTIGSQ